ncbi:HypC/HybG/HupF family hydrogenase formation chaperone [Sulfurospirillum deleyianum]|uniref:Hydrogenase assembly chaperone hypC/hupF n=1 Tax=Sulfurospirillum deleyianum (strain ATCC 51133 / DSM 6946 / 5175) TaxID=525898 RepID=D1B201_SULD5|nr:HypC/HybG/HupF family hydrogenase formation chaperone [Sulfurospirillum deleyianum]ACZ12121.1 hydrogenase assembly chaperone hypC/hupF [Sulfurospirillum deleyianum DSM 6946]
MCLSIPSKVVEIDENNYATVDTLGVKRKVTLDLIVEPVEVGDYVLIHVGFAMNKISKEEAEDSIAAYNEIAEAMKNGEIDDNEGNSNYV